MRSRNTLAGLALLVVALAPASHTLRADNGPYTVQDAGPVPGVAWGLNASAAVVGSGGASAPYTAFLTLYGGGPSPLTGLFAGSDDTAYGVHPDGWAVGQSTGSVYLYPKAVKFAAGGAVDLAPDSYMGAARAVNASGAIAGWMYADKGFEAVIWNGTSLVRFGPSTFAYAINDGGVITGTQLVGLTSRAFTWSAGGSQVELPSLGGNTSEGNGINNHGDVVGDSFRTGLLDEIAVYWPASGGAVDLGTLGGLTSSARDINNHGQIVGYARNAAGAAHAFLSDAGGPMIDLNTLLPADSGWVLVSANAINDAGQIAGEGIFDGSVRAFLLTPAVTADTTPPVVSSVTTTPDSIWPPRHQMVDVSVRVAASDDSGETPVCGVLGVKSNEPDNGDGDGDTSSDTELVGPGHVRVRAERSGPVGSRVYTVTVQCTDGSGNAATADGTVTIGTTVQAKASLKAKK